MCVDIEFFGIFQQLVINDYIKIASIMKFKFKTAGKKNIASAFAIYYYVWKSIQLKDKNR